MCLGVLFGVVTDLYARDLGVFVLPIHKGSLTSSLVYEHLKLEDDFNTRGRVTFKANVVGALFSYGITDSVSVAVKVEPSWIRGWRRKGMPGNLEPGISMELIFTMRFFLRQSLRPGVQLSGGVTGFQLPIDRADVSNSGMTAVDQKMSGVEYHEWLAVYRIWHR